jgi:hypothetical protein
MICPANKGLSAPDSMTKPMYSGVINFKLRGLDKNSHASSKEIGTFCLLDLL